MAITRVKLKTFLVLLSFYFLIAPTQAFFRHICHGELGNGRIDPIMAPGNPSQHVHILFGASSKYCRILGGAMQTQS
jgi:hypothetical protein